MDKLCWALCTYTIESFIISTFLSDLAKNPSNELYGIKVLGKEKYDIIIASQSQYKSIPVTTTDRKAILVRVRFGVVFQPNMVTDL